MNDDPRNDVRDYLGALTDAELAQLLSDARPPAPTAGPTIRDQFAAYTEQLATDLGADPMPNEYERQRRIAQQFADHFKNL